MLDRIDALFASFLRLFEWFTRLLVVLLTAATLVQILSRVANHPVSWSVEVSRILFTWLGFTGIVIALTADTVPTFPVLTERLAPKHLHILRILTTALVLLFLTTMFFATFRVLRLGHAQAMAILPLQWSFVYASFPVSLAILIILYALRLTRLVAELRRITPNPSG
jgi:TRAP-type transport system small permease protein